MKNAVLYYPTIKFQKEDRNWLWKASLLWDKVYRIVPKGYQIDEDSEIKELCSSDEIGVALYPERYAKSASEKFLQNVDDLWDAAALCFDHDDKDKFMEYCRLHKDKVDVSLRNLLEQNFYCEQNKEWLYVPSEMAGQYMVYLATEIADKNNLDLYTSRNDAWVASNYYLNADVIQDGFFPDKEYNDFRSSGALISLFVQDIFLKIYTISLQKKLLNFEKKEKTKESYFKKH